MAQPSRRDMTAVSTNPTRSSRRTNRAARRALKRAAVGGGSVSAAARSVVEQLEARQLMAAQPTAQLVNANTDRVIATMTDGMTVDLGKVGAALNINALPAGRAGSMVFKLDGRTVITETHAPFAIGADVRGNFKAWTPPTGRHTLQVLQYSRAGGTGSITASRTLRINVVGRAAAPAPAPAPAPLPVPNGVPVPTGPTNGGSAAAVLEVVGSRSGVAGMPVVVSAVNSRLPNGALHAQFHWDFGDAGGAYNRLTGWTAGHVYDRPGNYTVRLTVVDNNGSTSTAATTINVTGDGRRVVHVDAVAGRDSNPGTVGAPIKSFNRARQFATNNVKILFRRGQTWHTNGWLSVTGQNVHIGAYGAGANPVLRIAGGNTAIQTFGGSRHTVIENLTFDTVHRTRGHDADKIGLTGMYIGGSNVAVRNCTFLNLDDGVNANGQPRGFIFQDNDAPLTTGVRGYLAWLEGSDIVALGNRAVNSTREHNFRIKDGHRLLIAHNDLANISRRNVDGQDDTKGTIEMQRGSWAYIYGNSTRDGPVRVGPRGQGTEPRSTTTRMVVIENNRISNYQLNVMSGSHNISIRNNVFYANNRSAIAVNPQDGYGRTVSDIHIAGNTAYNSAATGRFLRVEGGLPGRTISLVRNRYVAGNLGIGLDNTAPVSVSASNLGGFRTIANNVWPVPRSIIKYAQGGVMWVNGGYNGQAGYKDPREWMSYPEVRGDVFRNSRPCRNRRFVDTDEIVIEPPAHATCAGGSLRATGFVPSNGPARPTRLAYLSLPGRSAPTRCRAKSEARGRRARETHYLFACFYGPKCVSCHTSASVSAAVAPQVGLLSFLSFKPLFGLNDFPRSSYIFDSRKGGGRRASVLRPGLWPLTNRDNLVRPFVTQALRRSARWLCRPAILALSAVRPARPAPGVRLRPPGAGGPTAPLSPRRPTPASSRWRPAS